MSSGRRLLVVDGAHLPEPSLVRAIVWEGERIVWLGEDPRAAPKVDQTLELAGAWVTPGFVDAHVHATATGLKLDGIDLTGAASTAGVADLVRAFAAERDDDPLIGSGWDEYGWPSTGALTADLLAGAAPGRRVLLDRVDGHSCLVDPVTLADVATDVGDGVDRDLAGMPTGVLREAAAARARQHVWRRLAPQRLDRARRAAAGHAARLGITALHEMGNPALSVIDDAIAWAVGDWPVDVLVWWADIDPSVALDRGLRPGGDLFLDGAIGSRTAAVTGGYRDGPALGGLFHADHEVVEFFARCTHAGIGGGVHAIGDQAIDQAIGALERVARDAGVPAVRACRHRIEHVELARPDHPARMAALGVVASMQPAFDALWGGANGLYASRFGAVAALASNPFADFAAAGCPMAFSSDSTVTPMAPLAAVSAATAHLGGRGIGRVDALAAATLGGRYVAGQDDVGRLAPAQRMDVSIWDGDPLAAGPAGPPGCLGIIVRGRTTFSS